ncbi:hypothetical protein GCM10027346_43320 [Hymenobacter seoulensis]
MALPKFLKGKIDKTGSTRGADDDVIFQNRVKRNNTVIINYNDFDTWKESPENGIIYEKGFIVTISPEQYFDNPDITSILREKGLELGNNLLIFYETRLQWNTYNPDNLQLLAASSRTNPLGGHYIARVPAIVSSNGEAIRRGFAHSGMKGAGIRVYEYSSSSNIMLCQLQLEYLYWLCADSTSISIEAGMHADEVEARIKYISKEVEQLGLGNHTIFSQNRIINSANHTICPLCLKELSAGGFLSRISQADGREVPDSTVTQVNLFHIVELRYGEFNHKPYNLGWGHHHCNTVVKDSGISETIEWMQEVIQKNIEEGYIF